MMTAGTMSAPWFSFLSDEASGAPVTKTGTSLRERARALNANQNGAIMVIGLCMACFLIGSLWSIIGIGDAIVFRDQMQEAADHSAFTSAALNAKGMNFISALNLVMMAFVFFHLVLGIINDLLFFGCMIPWVDIVCCPLWEPAHNAYVRYGNNIMKPACTGIHYAEMVAGYGYPWLGALKGYTVGTDYGHELSSKQRDLKVFAISTSLVPGTVMDPLINMAFKENSGWRRNTGGNTNSQKLGLPVSPNPYNAVCKFVGQEVLDVVMDLIDIPFKDTLKKWLGKIIGMGLSARYCNALGYNGSGTADVHKDPDFGGQAGKVNSKITDLNNQTTEDNKNLEDGEKPGTLIKSVDTDEGGKGLAQLDPGWDEWWGHDGPYYPWTGTGNGAPWNETWALNLTPQFVDAQEHAVAIGQRKLGVTSTAQAPFGYFAEAEFYFDCDGKWTDTQCNAANNAAYSVQWRARLRRTEFPQVLDLLTSYGGDWLGNLTSVSSAFSAVKNKIISVLPVGALQNLVAPALKGLKSSLANEVEKLAGKAGTYLDSKDRAFGAGIYH